MTPDAAIFQHIGWFLTKGARLYVDVWEIKLPLPYETTGLLALLSGGDMILLELLNVLLMMALACGIVGLVSIFAWNLTQDRFATILAGLSMLLLAGFFVRPAYGFKAKYPLLFTGLLALYLYTRGNPALSGAAAAASVGYWQGGLVFPLLVVGMALRDRDRTSLAWVVVGGLALTVAMLLPVFLVWHSTSEMLVQTVLVPVTMGESTPLLTRLIAGVAHFKWASPLLLVGGVGLALITQDVLLDRDSLIGRDEWWVPAGAAWFAYLVLFVDFEVGGYTDLIPGLAFVALGLGVVTARLDRRRSRHLLAGAIAAVLVVNVVLLGSLGVVFSPVETPGAVPMSELQTTDRTASVSALGTMPEIRYIYWNKQRPSTCHYRLSLMELQWLEKTKPYSGRQCLDMETAVKALR